MLSFARSYLRQPDLVRHAEAYGGKGSRVTSAGALAPTLEAAFGGVHLVDVPIDYSENTRVLTEELRTRRRFQLTFEAWRAIANRDRGPVRELSRKVGATAPRALAGVAFPR